MEQVIMEREQGLKDLEKWSQHRRAVLDETKKNFAYIY